MFKRVRRKVELKKEIESLLFSSGKMMKEKELADLTSYSEKEVKEALESLKKDYDERDTSLVLMNTGDSWKLNVREKYMGLVTKIVADTELPFPILETLGVIAYKAPAMQAEIVKARGTNAYEHVGILVEQGFVEKKKEGRSFKLSLTPKFFEYFDVADHEQMKDALKDIKPPEKIGKLDIVEVATKEEKEEGQKEGEKATVGDLEVVDVPPEEEKETIDTIKPDHEFLNSIDDKISELSKKNDELDQDDSFKRTTDLMKELGLDESGKPLKEEDADSQKKEAGESKEKEEEEPEDEEGDEETEDDSDEEESK